MSMITTDEAVGRWWPPSAGRGTGHGASQWSEQMGPFLYLRVGHGEKITIAADKR